MKIFSSFFKIVLTACLFLAFLGTVITLIHLIDFYPHFYSDFYHALFMLPALFILYMFFIFCVLFLKSFKNIKTPVSFTLALYNFFGRIMWATYFFVILYFLGWLTKVTDFVDFLLSVLMASSYVALLSLFVFVIRSDIKKLELKKDDEGFYEMLDVENDE